jgi:hypothetical protein
VEFEIVAPLVTVEGTTMVRLADGTIRVVEVHWYEAHGIGRKEIKIKRFLDEA